MLPLPNIFTSVQRATKPEKTPVTDILKSKQQLFLSIKLMIDCLAVVSTACSVGSYSAGCLSAKVVSFLEPCLLVKNTILEYKKKTMIDYYFRKYEQCFQV